MTTKVYWSSHKVPVIHVRFLMKLEFSREIFEKHSNIRLHENPSRGRRVIPCGHTCSTCRSKEVAVKLCIFFTLESDTENEQPHTPSALPQAKASGTHWPLQSQCGMDKKQTKNPAFGRASNPGCLSPSQSLYWLTYPTHIGEWIALKPDDNREDIGIIGTIAYGLVTE